MKTLILFLSLAVPFVSSINTKAYAYDKFPHEVLLECTVKMQRLGFNKEAANESCAISAGPSCSLLQSQVIQKEYPNCVGELIYLGVRPAFYALQFCSLAARRKSQCVPQQYIIDRENFVRCVRQDLESGEPGEVLNLCLEKILLKR